MKNNKKFITGICSLVLVTSSLIVSPVAAEQRPVDEEGNYINRITDVTTGKEIPYGIYKKMLKDSEMSQELQGNSETFGTMNFSTFSLEEEPIIVTDNNINDDTVIPPYYSIGESEPILLPSKATQYAGREYYTRFVRDSKSVVNGTKKRASKFIANCSRSNSTKRLSASREESWSTSISLSADELTGIKPGLGFTFNRSAKYEDTTSVTAKPGEIGWVAFTPRKNKAIGTVNYYINGVRFKQQPNVSITSPIKINGMLDGIDIAQSRIMTSDEKKQYCGK